MPCMQQVQERKCREIQSSDKDGVQGGEGTRFTFRGINMTFGCARHQDYLLTDCEYMPVSTSSRRSNKAQPS